MGSNSAAIEVQGEGYKTTADLNRQPFIITSFDGLRVKSGNTLALIAGEVNLNGGLVAANTGRVELGGVKEGLVNITTQGWSLDYQKGNIQKFGDIKFDSLALADASGTGSGSIQLQGRNISIKNGSRVFVQSRGKTARGKIEVNATESIQLVGTNSDT